MAIMYDGARFDTIAELVEYKKLMQDKTTSAEEPVATEQPTQEQANEALRKTIATYKAEQEEAQYLVINRRNQSYTNKEKRQVKGLLIEYNYGILPEVAKQQLAMQMGRTPASIQVMASHLRKKAGKQARPRGAIKSNPVVVFTPAKAKAKASGVNKDGTPDKRVARGKFIGSRAKHLCKHNGLTYNQAWAQAAREWEGKGLGKVTAEKQRHAMPIVFPLSQAGSDSLGEMLVNIAATNGNGAIDYQHSTQSLQLAGIATFWNTETWATFIHNFCLAKGKVATALGINNGKLKVELGQNGTHEIWYE